MAVHERPLRPALTPPKPAARIAQPRAGVDWRKVRSRAILYRSALFTVVFLRQPRRWEI